MKTIIIISELQDITTDKFIEWLYYYGFKDVVRINENDSVSIDSLHINNDRIQIELSTSIYKKMICLSESFFFYYRRGRLMLDKKQYFNNKKLDYFLFNEWNTCSDFILGEFEKRKSLGSYKKSVVNKLEYLKIARSCGLNIPETIVCDNYNKLNVRKKYITKPIFECLEISDNESFLDIKTIEVNHSEGMFFPSLFQKKISKFIEIRAFILYDEIYAMAIFSQENRKTSIDYRNYDHNKMNRFVPFNLPEKIKDKLKLFMNKIALNTGSVDIILSPDKKYYFLEINPAGSVEMVNNPCNYYIERRIAKMISHEE